MSSLPLLLVLTDLSQPVPNFHMLSAKHHTGADMAVYTGAVIPIKDDDTAIGVVSDDDFPSLAIVSDQDGNVVAVPRSDRGGWRGQGRRSHCGTQ